MSWVMRFVLLRALRVFFHNFCLCLCAWNYAMGLSFGELGWRYMRKLNSTLPHFHLCAGNSLWISYPNFVLNSCCFGVDRVCMQLEFRAIFCYRLKFSLALTSLIVFFWLLSKMILKPALSPLYWFCSISKRMVLKSLEFPLKVKSSHKFCLFAWSLVSIRVKDYPNSIFASAYQPGIKSAVWIYGDP